MGAVLKELNKLVDKKGNVIQSKQKAWGNKKVLLGPKQNKKRLMFLLFLFLLSIVFTALMVYFLGDDLYVNNFKELFEKTADITIPSKK
jgi:hypothetical protein